MSNTHSQNPLAEGLICVGETGFAKENDVAFRDYYARAMFFIFQAQTSVLSS
jgi:hypothetical protein